MGNLTVLDTFFMMLAVIPMSKMLSSIFMKMAVRNGTINQDKWAGMGLGALAGVTMLMMRSKGMGFGMGRQAGGPQNGGNIASQVAGTAAGAAANTARAATGGFSRGYQQTGTAYQQAGSSYGGYDQQGAAGGDLGGAGPSVNTSGTGTVGVPPIGTSNQGQVGQIRNAPANGSQRPAQGTGNTTQSHGSGIGGGPGINGAGGGPGINTAPGGGTASPGFVPPIGSSQGRGGSPTDIASDGPKAGEVGNRTMEDIISQSANQSNRFAQRAAMVGAASSFAAPEVAPISAGMFGLTGKATSSFAATAYHVSKEVKARTKNGQTFFGALQEMTGSDNRVAATAKAAATIAISPFGSKATHFGMKAGAATSKTYQWAKNKIN